MTYWLEVAVACDGEAAEAVAELLQPLAHQHSVVLEQRSDAHALAEDALDPQVTVKIYIAAEQDSPEVREGIREALYHLGRLYPIPSPTFRELEDEDWAHAWKAHYHPFRVGQRLWIQPSWAQAAAEIKPDDVVLILDPGMAFGTGLHPTTQMCLQALSEIVQQGDLVLDVGTGSGILAIAAAQLGAQRVLGVDTDELAVRAALDNAARNGVAGQVDVFKGSLSAAPEGPWNVVVVNILAPVIVDLLGHKGPSRPLLDYVAIDGHVILSGIIDRQEPDVIVALRQAGGYVASTLRVRDWVALVAQRRQAMPAATVEQGN